MDDNDQKHSCKTTKEWLQRKRLHTRDRHPTEMLWWDVKKLEDARWPSNLSQLADSCKEEWAKGEAASWWHKMFSCQRRRHKLPTKRVHARWHVHLSVFVEFTKKIIPGTRQEGLHDFQDHCMNNNLNTFFYVTVSRTSFFRCYCPPGWCWRASVRMISSLVILHMEKQSAMSSAFCSHFFCWEELCD